MTTQSQAVESLWARHHAQWRDTAQIASQWSDANELDPQLLDYSVQGTFWEVIERCGLTLLVTREYEHLVMALTSRDSNPLLSFYHLPHPSGLAVDTQRGVVHIASTRNPNQVYELAPVEQMMDRLDVSVEPADDKPLVPVASTFYPGCTYMHDLALINGQLYANAVGQNAIVRLDARSQYKRVWWPKCIEEEGGPVFGQNHIQLNSIAAGETIESSFFSASSTEIAALRPGDAEYPVDKRGVIFSGATREVMCTGLTRPHSARINQGRVWVDNSGYGELGYAEDGAFRAFAKLPGWTRGLCFFDDIAFVGTSRVIPRFSQYAPGLDVSTSICGVHAVDLKSGKTLGSLIWPNGNQIFAIDWVPRTMSLGFPFSLTRKRAEHEKLLFYTFSTKGEMK